MQLPPSGEEQTTEQLPSGIEHAPPHRRSPPPPQNWSTGQVPQSSQPPHPSVDEPHPYPRLVIVQNERCSIRMPDGTPSSTGSRATATTSPEARCKTSTSGTSGDKDGVLL